MITKKLMVMILLSTILSSCGTLIGIKRPIGLIDKPENLIVRNLNTGDTLKIDEGVFAISVERRFQYNYVGPRIKFKPKKNTVLELESNGVKKTISISKKTNVGMLVIEGIFTYGTFTLIDLITGGYNSHKPALIDCPALFEGKKARTDEELFHYVQVNSMHKL